VLFDHPGDAESDAMTGRMVTSFRQVVIGLDDWIVEVSRDLVELAGEEVPGTGRWITRGIFQGSDPAENERRAREIVENFRRILRDQVEHFVRARSGREILADKERRGLA
jgi:hypothetical protein